MNQIWTFLAGFAEHEAAPVQVPKPLPEWGRLLPRTPKNLTSTYSGERAGPSARPDGDRGLHIRALPGHFPIVAGIIVGAVGVEGVLAHAGDGKPLGLFYAAALYGGLHSTSPGTFSSSIGCTQHSACRGSSRSASCSSHSRRWRCCHRSSGWLGGCSFLVS